MRLTFLEKLSCIGFFVGCSCLANKLLLSQAPASEGNFLNAVQQSAVVVVRRLKSIHFCLVPLYKLLNSNVKIDFLKWK